MPLHLNAACFTLFKCAFSHFTFNDIPLSLSLSQGPFVHVASLCAALLSKFMAALFGGIYMVRIINMLKTDKFPLRH